MDLDDLDSLGSKDSNRNSQASVVSEDGEPLPTSPPAPLLSPSAHNYVRVKQERLRMGEVDSFRGINSADISQEQAQQSIEDPRFRTKVEAVLKRLLAFARSPGELATFLATELRATKVRCGYALCLIGEPADSMIVLVDGYAQVHAKEIGAVGVLGPGASFGEAALMGLLHVRTATVQALQDCTVVELRQEVLERAKFRRVKESLLLLAYERCQQSQQCVPMCALPLGISPQDPCAAIVALHAERMDIPPGEVWLPMPDSHPSGPHFGVLVAGFAHVEVDGRRVSRLKAGSFVPEGVLADSGALIRAASNCLAYRVQQYDLLLAVGSRPDCRDWYDRCRDHERQAREALLQRLRTAIKAPTSVSTIARPGHQHSEATSPCSLKAKAAPQCVLKAPPVFPVEDNRKRIPQRRKKGSRAFEHQKAVEKANQVPLKSSSTTRLDRSRSYGCPSSQRSSSKTRSASQSALSRSDSHGSHGALPVVHSSALPSGVSKGPRKRFTTVFDVAPAGDLYHCTSTNRPATVG
ncbi:unnamed protein product [Symbiodinium natans]|uniref:Cyclic nucleotide-binding domain-containing protein n=1 Tax=Symbiodinium natans TaxID=878477 RepID=A0A812V1H8_9DINO|nr:unnamed protein product [Symbiodinium natans]